MTWQEAYRCFEYIVEKYHAIDEDTIEHEVNQLYAIMKGYEPFDKAYQKWMEDIENNN